MTRIEAMREAIRVMEKERRIYSIRCEGLKPAPGGEEQFHKYDDIIKRLKEVCQVLQVESVKRSIAAWQHDLMEEPDLVKMAMKELEPGA